MMTRSEHLLCILAEECAEVAQRVSKALRFTLAEVQPGQDRTNAERIGIEFADRTAVMDMLLDEGALLFPDDFADMITAKQAKVEQFLKHSQACGTLATPVERAGEDK